MRVANRFSSWAVTVDGAVTEVEVAGVVEVEVAAVVEVAAAVEVEVAAVEVVVAEVVVAQNYFQL
jgi:hypothetical protein